MPAATSSSPSPSPSSYMAKSATSTLLSQDSSTSTNPTDCVVVDSSPLGAKPVMLYACRQPAETLISNTAHNARRRFLKSKKPKVSKSCYFMRFLKCKKPMVHPVVRVVICGSGKICLTNNGGVLHLSTNSQDAGSYGSSEDPSHRERTAGPTHPR